VTSANLLFACIVLLVSGFAYNAYIGHAIAAGRGDFQARYVALGVGGTLLVLGIITGNWPWVGITLLAFACSGAGMTWGSWQRRNK